MLRQLCAVEVDAQPEGTLPDIQSAEEAVRYLRAKGPRSGSGTRPYFLAVGLHKPHVPFKFPKKFLDNYPLESIVMPADPYRDVANNKAGDRNVLRDCCWLDQVQLQNNFIFPN